MNGADEGLTRTRWPHARDGEERRSARRIAMRARRRQENDLGCVTPSRNDGGAGQT
jgi:hypothetical protein